MKYILMVIFMLLWPFLLSSIAGLSTLIGCLFIFLPIKKKDEFIAFSLSLSLSVMLMVSVFDLIPEALKNLNEGVGRTYFTFAIFFLIGVFLVNIINKMIKKIKDNGNLYRLGILNFIALVLHNLPEGILTFMSTYSNFKLGLSLCIAITLHNIPEGISIAVPIYYATGSKWKAIKNTLISGIAEPFGALMAFIILKKYVTPKMISLFLVLVAGIMITLSINKMLPEALKYNKKKQIYIGLIIGTLLVFISLFLH